MESHNTSLPDVSVRGRLLQRSHSLQPENGLYSSPSSRRSKNPGRNLTEIFTGSSRASSCEASTLLRRRTVTARPTLYQTSSIGENFDSSFFNRSFSELSYSLHNNDNSVSSTLDNQNDSTNRISSFALPAPEMRMPEPMETDITDSQYIMSLAAHESKCPLTYTAENTKLSMLRNAFKIAFRILLLIISILLVSTLFLVGSKTYFDHWKTQCNMQRTMKMPIDELERQFSSLVNGQEIAINVILKSLRDFEVNNIENPLILWMVGWTGTGKTHTVNILKHVFSSISKSFTLIPSLLPQNLADLRKEVFRIFQQLDSCSYNLIVIDDWDKDSLALHVLKQFVSYQKDAELYRKVKGRILLVLLGTQGSYYVNQEYLKIVLGGKKRNDVVLVDFSIVVKETSQAQELNNITNSYVFVPFMPMDKEQVRLCIVEELLKLEKAKGLAKTLVKEEIISDVMKQIQFIPPNNPLLANTGCKRVQPLLRLLVSVDRSYNV